MSPAPYLALVLALAAICQLFAYRVRVPSILFLLITGFALGQLVRPDDVLGREVLFAGVNMCVGIILFEGALSLRFRDLRGLSKAVWRLCTATVVLAWALITAAALVAGIAWELALLIGALLVVTGPTVIAPILRQLRPTRRVASMLRWEGIVVDPIGAILAVLVFQAIIVGAPEGAFATAALTLGKTVLVSTVLTLLFGGLLELALRRHLVPDFLDGVIFLSVAVGALVVSNQLQSESGLLTVTMLGIYLANRPGLNLTHVREFKEDLQVLIVGVLFVLLGGRVSPERVVAIAPTALIFVTLLIFVVRPVSIWLGLMGSSATRQERTLLSFMAPRGIVAAAVASIFALELERAASEASLAASHGGQSAQETLALQAYAERLATLLDSAVDLVPLVFVTIVVTVAVYGLGVGRLAERLGLATTIPSGVLFAGAPTWARQAADLLAKLDVPTLLVSLAPGEVRQARMAGLRIERTHILSEYAVEDMELAGIGSFVASTYDDETNSTAAREFARTLGSQYTFAVGRQEDGVKDTQRTAAKLTTQVAFDPPLSAPQLEQRLQEGMQVRQTKLTEKHTLSMFRDRQPDAVLMFYVKDGTAHVVSTETTVPETDATLLALVRPRGGPNG